MSVCLLLAQIVSSEIAGDLVGALSLVFTLYSSLSLRQPVCRGKQSVFCCFVVAVSSLPVH